MRTSYHTMAHVKAPRDTIVGLIKDWLGKNAFRLQSSAGSIPMIAKRGMRFPGLTDDQTGTKMGIIVRELDGACAISIQHKTTRLLFITGLMFGDILMTKSEQLISHIKDNT